MFPDLIHLHGASMSQPVIILAFLHAKPAKNTELANEIRNLVTASQDDAGCLQYGALVSNEDPNLFVFNERWASQEALDLHARSAHFQAFWTKRMEFLERDVEMISAVDLM